MILFVGLGNPGSQYAQNRHNIGFWFADYLQGKLPDATAWKEDEKHKALVSTGTFKGEKCIVAKPQTFMNDSGLSVQSLANFYKISADHIYVAHDDLDIPLGKFKLHLGRGPKLHNGLDSISEKLGTQNYHRIRIGVENRPTDNRISGEAYVLQNIPIDEKLIYTDEFEQIYARLLLEISNS